MTRDQKLAYHLEMVIWATLPEGAAMSAAEIGELIARATPDQHRAAYERARVRSPMLLPEEY